MNQENTYAIHQDLVQAIVNNLNQQPAGAARPLLNAIEAVCTKQDQERAEATRLAEREAIKRELEQQANPVHTNAQPLPESTSPANT